MKTLFLAVLFVAGAVQAQVPLCEVDFDHPQQECVLQETAKIQVPSITDASGDYFWWRKWHNPTLVDWTLLTSAELLILVDVLQTLDMKNHPELIMGEDGLGYLVMGRFPSQERILATGFTTMAVVGVAWYFLHEPWRTILTSTITIGEIPNVAWNHFGAGMRIHF